MAELTWAEKYKQLYAKSKAIQNERNFLEAVEKIRLNEYKYDQPKLIEQAQMSKDTEDKLLARNLGTLDPEFLLHEAVKYKKTSTRKLISLIDEIAEKTTLSQENKDQKTRCLDELAMSESDLAEIVVLEEEQRIRHQIASNNELRLALALGIHHIFVPLLFSDVFPKDQVTESLTPEQINKVVTFAQKHKAQEIEAIRNINLDKKMEILNFDKVSIREIIDSNNPNKSRDLEM